MEEEKNTSEEEKKNCESEEEESAKAQQADDAAQTEDEQHTDEVQKPKAAESDTESDADLKAENDRLREQLADMQVQAEVNGILQGYTLVPKAAGYISKLIDVKSSMKDGKADRKAIKAQIDAVLADLPQLSQEQKQNKGVIRIGAKPVGDRNDEIAASHTAQVAQKRWNRFNN